MSKAKKLKTSHETTTASKVKVASGQSNSDEIKIKEDEELRKLRVRDQIWIGAHVSAANGIENAITNGDALCCNSVAFFLKNQRRWDFKPLEKKNSEMFMKKMKDCNYLNEQFLPHGSYLVNLGNPDEAKRAKSYAVFLDDLKRCDECGIKLYNIHPGSTVGECSRKESIELIADAINNAINETQQVKVLLETMAGQKNIIGSKFEELNEIISLVKCKERVGVCLDTCHIFAAGYDIRTREKFQKVLDEFDKQIGLSYLNGVHLNDSKSDLNSGLDRHENIGKGKIGLEAFRFIMNEKVFRNIPIVLETPANGNDESIYRKEIALLYSLVESHNLSSI